MQSFKISIKKSIQCLIFLLSSQAYSIEFPSDHCVAWKTLKTQFMFKRVEAVGVSCEISAEIVSIKNGVYVARVEVPIKSFDSGNPSRDEDVFEILKGSFQPNIVVETIEMSRKDLESVFAGNQSKVIGIIQVASKSYPVEIQLTGALKGVIITKFSDFEIAPPSVLGGLIAKVDDSLELHFRLNRKKVDNYF